MLLLMRSSVLILAVTAFVIGIGHALRQYRRRLRIELGETRVPVSLLHIVRIVAFGADPPALFSTLVPHTDALAMDAVSPGAIDLPVAFSSQLLRLVEADLVAVVINKFGACGGMVAVQTPDRIFAMF